MLGNIGELIMGFTDISLDIKRGLNTTARARSLSRSLSTRRKSSSHRESSPSSNVEEQPQNTAPNPEDSGVTRSSNEEVKSEQSSGSVLLNNPVTDSKVSSEENRSESSLGKASSHVTIESPGLENQTAGASGPPAKFDLESVLNAGKTAAKVFNMTLKVPTDFTLAVAKGFHNAPLLYGDDTVRETAKITGIKSGFKAAGRVSQPNVSLVRHELKKYCRNSGTAFTMEFRV